MKRICGPNRLGIRVIFAMTVLLAFVSAVSAQPRCETVLLDEKNRITGTFPGTFTTVITQSSIELAEGDSLVYEIGLQPENGGYIDIDISLYKDSLNNLIFFDTINIDNSGPPTDEIHIEKGGLYFVESVAAAEYIASGFTSVRAVAFHDCEDKDRTAANFYNQSTGLLTLKIAVDETSYALSFIVNMGSSPTIQGLLQSLEAISPQEDDFATFDSSTGKLLIPELVINGVVAYRNVTFLLRDASQLLFQLESLE